MQQQPHAYPPGAQRPMQPVKKGMSGCLIAFLVFLGLGVASAAGIGIYLYVEFAEFVGASGEMAKLMLDAEKAPGTSALRSAGCRKAYVLEQAKLIKVAQRFEDEIARREGRAAKPLDIGDVGFIISCDAGFKTLSCADVAKAFVASEKPTLSLLVSVKETLTTKSEKFSAAGVSMGAADSPTLPDDGGTE